jgi:hypothetical protein
MRKDGGQEDGECWIVALDYLFFNVAVVQYNRRCTVFPSSFCRGELIGNFCVKRRCALNCTVNFTFFYFFIFVYFAVTGKTGKPKRPES